MILLVGYYASEVREHEFAQCLRRNYDNLWIEEVHVFCESAAPAQDNAKRKLVYQRRRETFADLFTYANEHFAGQIVAIANADICFDETLSFLDNEKMGTAFYALSRWDETPAGLIHFAQKDSQDAWIFRAPVPRVLVQGSGFYFGLPGCDNRLVYEAQRAALTVSNPSQSIRARHLHAGERRWGGRATVPGPYAFVPPSPLPYAVMCVDGVSTVVPPATQLEPSKWSAPAPLAWRCGRPRCQYRPHCAICRGWARV